MRILFQKVVLDFPHVLEAERVSQGHLLQGITDRHAARDWVQAVTGVDPGLLHRPVAKPKKGEQ